MSYLTQMLALTFQNFVSAACALTTAGGVKCWGDTPGPPGNRRS